MAALRTKSKHMPHAIKLELLQCRYPRAYFKHMQRGLPARPVSV